MQPIDSIWFKQFSLMYKRGAFLHWCVSRWAYVSIAYGFAFTGTPEKEWILWSSPRLRATRKTSCKRTAFISSFHAEYSCSIFSLQCWIPTGDRLNLWTAVYTFLTFLFIVPRGFCRWRRVWRGASSGSRTGGWRAITSPLGCPVTGRWMLFICFIYLTKTYK